MQYLLVNVLFIRFHLHNSLHRKDLLNSTTDVDVPEFGDLDWRVVMSSDDYCQSYLRDIPITLLDREREIFTIATEGGITLDEIGLESLRNNPQLGAQLLEKILQDIQPMVVKPMYKQRDTLEALCKRNPKLLDEIHSCLASIPGEGYIPSFDSVRGYGTLLLLCVHLRPLRFSSRHYISLLVHTVPDQMSPDAEREDGKLRLPLHRTARAVGRCC